MQAGSQGEERCERRRRIQKEGSAGPGSRVQMDRRDTREEGTIHVHGWMDHGSSYTHAHRDEPRETTGTQTAAGRRREEGELWACLDPTQKQKIFKIPRHIKSYGTCMEH
jgi:hypothetical protein